MANLRSNVAVWGMLMLNLTLAFFFVDAMPVSVQHYSVVDVFVERISK